MKYAMEIQILVWKKLIMVAGLKLLMDHNPPTILIFDLPIHQVDDICILLFHQNNWFMEIFIANWY
jgi:hypothetical protein